MAAVATAILGLPMSVDLAPTKLSHAMYRVDAAASANHVHRIQSGITTNSDLSEQARMPAEVVRVALVAVVPLSERCRVVVRVVIAPCAGETRDGH